MNYIKLYSQIMDAYFASGCTDYWWNHRTRFILLCRKNDVIC